MKKHMLNNKKMIVFLLIIAIILFSIYQNNAIAIRKINYKNNKIPKGFEGYTIAHISDLHNKRFGHNQGYLLNKIKKTRPDLIVVTGDLIDRRRYDLGPAMVFIEGAMEIAPVYYVAGNHEAWSGEYANIKAHLQESGAQVLDDQKMDLVKGDDRIEILGVLDPAFLTSNHGDGTDLSQLARVLTNLSDDSVFQILLSHRPELFDLYADRKIDLIFSGHAHGGQVRLPFVGGLIAPNQGLFPKYTSGVYRKEEATMIVSPGLGNSIIPQRVFNRPEIIVISLGPENN